jgi:hypothetical protein
MFVKPVPFVLTANTAPLPEPPPEKVVPYNVLPDKNILASGKDPSLLEKRGRFLFVNVWRIVKSLPLVLTEIIVPLPSLPPLTTVPYKVPSDKTNPA